VIQTPGIREFLDQNFYRHSSKQINLIFFNDFYDFLIRHLKNVKSPFLISEKNVKYGFSNTGSNAEITHSRPALIFTAVT